MDAITILKTLSVALKTLNEEYEKHHQKRDNALIHGIQVHIDMLLEGTGLYLYYDGEYDTYYISENDYRHW